MTAFLNLTLIGFCIIAICKLRETLETIQKNTTNMERHTSELLDKASRLDHLFNALKQIK